MIWYVGLASFRVSLNCAFVYPLSAAFLGLIALRREWLGCRRIEWKGCRYSDGRSMDDPI